jgi:Domain of unknown function (DUF6089)
MEYKIVSRLSTYICCFMVVAFLQFESFAQKKELGFGLGGINYKGDLAPNFQPFNIKPAGEVFFKYNIFSFLSFKVGFLTGKIGAADSMSRDPFLKVRNFHFSGDVNEFSGRVEYNFFNFRPKNIRRRFEKWCPFLFFGVAASQYKVKNNVSDESFKSTQFVIPFGVGVKHYLHPSWNLTAEFGARKMFTDTLDGIVYDANVPKFSQTNPNNMDMYFYTGISISYLFQGVRCPVTEGN